MPIETKRNAALKAIVRDGVQWHTAERRKLILSLSPRWNYAQIHTRTFNNLKRLGITDGFLIGDNRYLVRLTLTGKAIQDVYYQDLALKLERTLKRLRAEKK